MNCLVVIAHPIENSLCKYLAQQTINHLESRGYQLTIKDLYASNFDPVLNQDERASYYSDKFDDTQLAEEIETLKQAESLVLIFPTWWFSFPAILKGWFDRVWAPGHVYDHASDLGPLKARLTNLKEMKVVTTLGSPWWVDYFILRKPVKRVLKMALMGTCTKKCKFQMLSLYKSEKVEKARLEKFVRKIKNTL